MSSTKLTRQDVIKLFQNGMKKVEIERKYKLSHGWLYSIISEYQHAEQIQTLIVRLLALDSDLSHYTKDEKQSFNALVEYAQKRGIKFA